MDTKIDQTGLLGDSPRKSYGTKLELFNRFAEPELRQLIAELELRTDDRILDAGCGPGLITTWLAAHAPEGFVLGIDLSGDHVRQAQRQLSAAGLSTGVLQADMTALPVAADMFDAIWCSNSINHLRDPVAGIKALAERLKAGGRLVLGQSAFLPDMFFAWDARLEDEVKRACYQYYRDKYGLNERDTTAARNLFGWTQQANLQDIAVKTIVIERTAPLTDVDKIYFVEGVFKGYWGHRVQPYLAESDWQRLQALCDPDSPAFCLHRADFHHIQTFTVVVGTRIFQEL